MENEKPIGSNPTFQAPKIEQQSEQFLLSLPIINDSMGNHQDREACKVCEATVCKIDNPSCAAQMRFSYSQRAGRFLRERYRMVQDGCVEDRVHGMVECWTLIDTEGNQGQGAPVLVVQTMTPRATEAARVLALPPLDPTPAFYRVPIYSSEDRLRALALCERWNIAAAHVCPSCCQRFPEGDVPDEEAPYLNRAQLLCSTCHEERKQRQHHH